MRPQCLTLITSLLALAMAASCGRHEGEFRLQGKVKHFRQGEFYVYSAHRFDTVRVSDFKFKYHRPAGGPEVLTLLFPNFQRMPVVARAGHKLTMKTDARNFNNTSITGDDENRELSRFFRENGGLPPKRLRAAASVFIRRHPELLASEALLRYCYIDGAAEPEPETAVLLKEMMKAQPANASLPALQRKVATALAVRKGSPLPPFKAQTVEGRNLSQADLRGHYALITFWADWHNASYSNLRRVRELWKRYGGRLKTLNVSLDADRTRALRTIKRDSVPSPNVCDTRCFDSPLVRTFAVNTLPTNILVDPDGRIVGRDLLPDEIRRRLDPHIPH